MKTCRVCRQPKCSELIHFGSQPICHHFIDGSGDQETYPLILGQCESCGLTQLMEPIPVEKMVPRFDWITYNEPEAHLDSVVDVLRKLPGITPQSAICGLSYKEDSTLNRFNKLGYKHTWRADTRIDFEITDTNAGIETLQARVRSELANRIREKYGAPDIVIVRHVLEHTDDTLGFMEALHRLVKPTGYVVFEVPDCARAFDMLDYTTLWEDHRLYFVESSFLMCLQRGGFSLVRFERYHALYENCLVAVVQPNPTTKSPTLPDNELQLERQRAAGFAKGFEGRRKGLRELLTDWRSRGRIAMFGAGHQSAMFVNVLGLGEVIDFFVDDDPRKCGLSMPGSRTPIMSSDLLVREKVKLCLTSVSAESEKKVIRKHQTFIEQGGTFASIFPVHRDSLLNLIAGPGLDD